MNVMGTRAILVIVAIVGMAIMSGCNSNSGSDTTPAPAGTSLPAPTEGGGAAATPTGIGIRGQAKVDSLEVNTTGNPPSVKVQVVARGSLPDGCTKITDISQKLEGNTFTVTLGTFRAPNVMCIQIVTPFIQTVDLDVAGLKAGTYTVNVDNATKQFTLNADNGSK